MKRAFLIPVAYGLIVTSCHSNPSPRVAPRLADWGVPWGTNGGIIPASQQAPQTMAGDVTGTTNNNKVVNASGIPAGGLFNWKSAGTTIGAYGFLPGDPTQTALYFAPQAAAPTSTNFMFQSDSTGRVVANSPGGAYRLQASGILAIGIFSTETDFYLPPVPSADNSIKLGVVGGQSWSTVSAYKHEFTNTTDPSTPAVGAVAYGAAGNLRIKDTLGTIIDDSPQPVGTVNTQAEQNLSWQKYCRVTVTGGTCTFNVPLATATTNCDLQVTAKAKIATAGSSNSVGDTFRDTITGTFKNVGGTVSQVGSTVALALNTDTSLNTSTLVFSISGTNVVITLTLNATAGTLGNADSTLTINQQVN